jgi:hypothetical protein
VQVIQTILHWSACETPAALSIDLEREGEREREERGDEGGNGEVRQRKIKEGEGR